MASEQNHVAIKYQVFVYNEEVKDGRMITRCLEKQEILVWKTKQSRKGEIDLFNNKKNETSFINPICQKAECFLQSILLNTKIRIFIDDDEM